MWLLSSSKSAGLYQISSKLDNFSLNDFQYGGWQAVHHCESSKFADWGSCDLYCHATLQPTQNFTETRQSVAEYGQTWFSIWELSANLNFKNVHTW